MNNKKILILSKYSHPWVGVPLIKNIISHLGDKVEAYENKFNHFKSLSIPIYSMAATFNLLFNTQKYNKIMLYNDSLLVILTFPFLKFISFFKSVECYYLFESKWFSKHGDRLAPILAYCLNNKIYKRIFVFDELLKEYLSSKNVKDKFSYLGTGIDINLFSPIPKKFDYSLLYVGTLHPRRKNSIMLHSIKKVIKTFPEIKLTIVGAGGDMQNLKKLTKKLSLEKNVAFVGEISQDKVPDYIRNSDICLAQYPKEEFNIQLPFKTLEYIACKKPVITTITKSTKKYFENNKNILMVNFNSEELANAIIRLIKDKKLRQKIAKEGLDLSKNFRWEKVIEILRDNLNNSNPNHSTN